MNMLKKGPELKIPDIKAPDFLRDIYYDLKERHLLPLVVILLIALVALPLALSKSSNDDAAEEAAAIAAPSSTTQATGMIVAKAAPGLRDYRDRLSGRTAKSPFQQPPGSGEEGEAGESSGSPTEATEASGGSTEEASGGSSSEGSPTNEGSGNSEPPEGGELQYFSFAIDVRITPVSSKKDEKSTVRHNLPEMTMLPSRNVPAFTFVGVTKDEKNAVMLISDKVTGLFGDATCIEGSERCQLVALEPGIPETVVYGADARTYRITLLKLRLLKTDKLNTAPLGKSGKGSKGGKEQSLASEGFASPTSAAASG